ncbi:MAG: sulfatase-like hydrolase/transferase [bacterium]|nr:sulfatase-like hydrolase/transferase [bacterium]
MTDINRRRFIQGAGALAAGAAAWGLAGGRADAIVDPPTLLPVTKPTAGGQAAKRPNVLWIQTDEQRPDSLGCYGSTWARTPNLDRLAREGAVFNECHVQSPVCVASRTSQLFCRYPQELGVYDNKYFYEAGILDPDLPSFPQIFARAGYRTASYGKWHTPRPSDLERNQSLPELRHHQSV